MRAIVPIKTEGGLGRRLAWASATKQLKLSQVAPHLNSRLKEGSADYWYLVTGVPSRYCARPRPKPLISKRALAQAAITTGPTPLGRRHLIEVSSDFVLGAVGKELDLRSLDGYTSLGVSGTQSVRVVYDDGNANVMSRIDFCSISSVSQAVANDCHEVTMVAITRGIPAALSLSSQMRRNIESDIGRYGTGVEPLSMADVRMLYAQTEHWCRTIGPYYRMLFNEMSSSADGSLPPGFLQARRAGHKQVLQEMAAEELYKSVGNDLIGEAAVRRLLWAATWYEKARGLSQIRSPSDITAHNVVDASQLAYLTQVLRGAAKFNWYVWAAMSVAGYMLRADHSNQIDTSR